MFVLPIGPYAPVAPIAPGGADRRAQDESRGEIVDAIVSTATRPTRSATAIASHATRAALDDIKLGG